MLVCDSDWTLMKAKNAVEKIQRENNLHNQSKLQCAPKDNTPENKAIVFSTTFSTQFT